MFPASEKTKLLRYITHISGFYTGEPPRRAMLTLRPSMISDSVTEIQILRVQEKTPRIYTPFPLWYRYTSNTEATNKKDL